MLGDGLERRCLPAAHGRDEQAGENRRGADELEWRGSLVDQQRGEDDG